jgi:hypothetical protein
LRLLLPVFDSQHYSKANRCCLFLILRLSSFTALLRRVGVCLCTVRWVSPGDSFQHIVYVQYMHLLRSPPTSPADLHFMLLGPIFL